MVQAEAGTAADRSRIAAVIYNRLRVGMPLGIDATLRYGLHIPPTQSITEAELNSTNLYNTRLHYGLPPTPIDNPGIASLEAAAHPSKLGYLYFVRIPGTNRSAFFESSTVYYSYLKKHHYGRRTGPRAVGAVSRRRHPAHLVDADGHGEDLARLVLKSGRDLDPSRCPRTRNHFFETSATLSAVALDLVLVVDEVALRLHVLAVFHRRSRNRSPEALDQRLLDRGHPSCRRARSPSCRGQ